MKCQKQVKQQGFSDQLKQRKKPKPVERMEKKGVDQKKYVSVNGYPKFLINRDGRVFNSERMEFEKEYIYKKHYPIVTLSGDKKYVHRLLAEHFIDNPICKKEVNHKDGNKLNYSLDNLEWATHKENMAHANNTGLRKCSRKMIEAGRKAGQRSRMFSVKEVEMIQHLSAKYTVYKISRLLACSDNVITKIAKGVSYEH